MSELLCRLGPGGDYTTEIRGCAETGRVFKAPPPSKGRRLGIFRRAATGIIEHWRERQQDRDELLLAIRELAGQQGPDLARLAGDAEFHLRQIQREAESVVRELEAILEAEKAGGATCHTSD